MFRFRTQTLDSYIYYKIVHKNEYQLPDSLDGKIIIDIGAHIGSFSIACLNRKSDQIYAYEAHPDNYKIAKENINKISNNAIIENFAVVGHNDDSEIGYNDLSFNTGQHKVSPNNKTKTVKTIRFDDIVNSITDKYNNIDILKIDCEGYEYPILYTSKLLNKIENVAGEYHNNVDIIDKDSIFEYNGNGMINFLKSSGFFIYHQYIKDAGLFFAVKNINNSPFLINKELFK